MRTIHLVLQLAIDPMATFDRRDKKTRPAMNPQVIGVHLTTSYAKTMCSDWKHNQYIDTGLKWEAETFELAEKQAMAFLLNDPVWFWTTAFMKPYNF